MFFKKNSYFNKVILVLFTVFLLFSTLLFSSAAEEKVVKIGLLAPITGLMAADGLESERGAQLAIKEINAAGGINGYKLKLLTADVKDKTPDKVLSAVFSLIASGADCLLSSSGGGNNFEIRDVAEKNIPYLLSAETAQTEEIIKASPEKYPTIWSLAPNYDAYETEVPRFLEKWIAQGKFVPGERKFGVVTNDSPYSLKIAQGMKKTLEEKYGWTSVLYETVPCTDINDWRPILAKLHIYKPTFVLNADYVTSNAAVFMRQFNENPWNAIVFIQYAPVLEEFIELAKEYSTGVLYSLLGGPLPNLKTVEHSKKYEEEYNENVSGVYGVYMYEGVYVYADALRKVGDSKKYLEIGKAIGETDKETMMGRLVFDQKTHLAMQGDEYYPFQLYQIWDGKRYLLNPEKLATGEFKLPLWFE